MSELAPCPFCGNAPKVCEWIEMDNKPAWHIGCEHDGCEMASTLTCFTEAEATAAWNTRTQKPQEDDARDGERYRWLRDQSVPPHNFYLSVPVEFADTRYTSADVDAAIDAAIQSAKEKT